MMDGSLLLLSKGSVCLSVNESSSQALRLSCLAWAVCINKERGGESGRNGSVNLYNVALIRLNYHFVSLYLCRFESLNQLKMFEDIQSHRLRSRH